MIVTIKPNIDDYRAFADATAKRAKSEYDSRLLKFLEFFYSMLLWILIALFLVSFLELDSTFGATVVLFGSGIFALLGLKSVILKLRWRSIRSSGQSELSHPRTIEIAETGIEEVSSLYTSHTKWEAVIDLIETKDHVFVLINPFSGHIIPKVGFPTTKDVKSFIDRIEEYRADARMDHSDT